MSRQNIVGTRFLCHEFPHTHRRTPLATLPGACLNPIPFELAIMKKDKE